jgi:exonuclease SbcC
MTFTKLTLQDFQCHRRLEIPLSQITTIVGSSDSGKSAIVRALNYLCLNNLRGNSFITHGKDKCAITLEVDGQTIQRTKTKTSNSYATETNEYAAVSSEVPPEIAKILNIGEINIANQHDPLFWFSLTSGQLAKELNAIADIAWVDRVLQVSVSDLRKLNAEIDVTNSRVSELEAESKQTEWTIQADEELQRLESLEAKCEYLAESRHRLSELVNRLESAQSQIEQLQEVIDSFAPVQKAYNAADTHRQRHRRLNSLLSSLPDTRRLQAAVDGFVAVQESYTTADSLRQQYKRLNTLLESLPDTKNFQEAADDFAPVQERYAATSNLQQRYKRLDSLLSTLPEAIPTSEEVGKLQKRFQNLADIENAKRRLTDFIEQSEDYESQIQVLSKNLQDTEQKLQTQTKGACPICQRQLPS